MLGPPACHLIADKPNQEAQNQAGHASRIMSHRQTSRLRRIRMPLANLLSILPDLSARDSRIDLPNFTARQIPPLAWQEIPQCNRPDRNPYKP